MTLHLTKLEFTSSKDSVCLIWLKLSARIWEDWLFKFVSVFCSMYYMQISLVCFATCIISPLRTMNKSGLKIYYLQMHAWLMFHSEEPSTEFPVPILDKNALQWVLLILVLYINKKKCLQAGGCTDIRQKMIRFSAEKLKKSCMINLPCNREMCNPFRTK